MKNYLMIFISAIIAGMFIAFGATLYLTSAVHDGYLYKIIGAFLFGIGLFTIIQFGFWLYTGKVGYILDNKPKYLLSLLICLIGNILGVFILSSILKLTHIINNDIINLCKSMVETKQNESWYEVIILSAMCGIMIYLAVEGHKKCEYAFGKVIVAFMPIVLFILCGFEHVVANVCYYTYAGLFNGKVVLYFLLMAIGNGLGSLFFDGSRKIIEKLKA